MPRQIKKNSADVTDYFFILDATDGSPETGVTITDLDLQYVRNGAAPSAKVDATALAATDSAHSDNKAIEIDATDQPGLYRVDWPDAAFATGVDQVILTVNGTGFQPAHKEIQLVDYDPTDSVRLGLTALPAAAADAAGGLPISDAGGLDMDNLKAELDGLQGADGKALISSDAQDLSATLDVNAKALGGTVQSATDLKDFADAGYDPATNKVQGVVLVDTTTTNSDMRGTDNAATAAKLLAYTQLLARSDAAIETDNATELTAINADGGSGAGDYSAQTDSQEAIRNNQKGTDDAIPTKNSGFSNITFLMVDATDHFTPETGLTVTGQRSLDGAAFAGVAGSIAEIANGIYQFDAAAADMNGDMIIFRFSASGAADTFITMKTTS